MSNEKYLVRADEIESMQGLRKAHFLNNNAVRINKSLGDLTGLTGLGIHIIEVEPGCDTTEFHLHHHEDECIFILEGEATATIGDDQFAVSAGDFIGYRKGGLPHSVTNTGSTTLKCLVAGERLPHDVGDYPNKKKRIFRNQGLAWNVVNHENLEEPDAGAKN